MIDTVTAHRLTALNSLNILDTPREPAYDAITRLACHICDCPISLISFLTEKKQFFKSHQGLSINQSVVEYSFCARTILQPNDIFIIEDAHIHSEFKNNPLVTGYPNIVFYAGIPLINHAGIPLGTLSVIDTKINSLTVTQIARLKDLAGQVIELINAREERNKTENPISNRPVDISEERLENLLSLPRLVEIETTFFGKCSSTENFNQLVEQYLKDLAEVYPQLDFSFIAEQTQYSLQDDLNAGRWNLFYKTDALKSQTLIPGKFREVRKDEMIENEFSKNNILETVYSLKHKRLGRLSIKGELNFPLTQFITERISRFLSLAYEYFQTYQELKQTHEKLGYVNKTLSELIYEWDLEANTFKWGSNYEPIFGKQKDYTSLGIQSWKNRIHPNSSEKIINEKLRTLNQPKNNSWKQEYKILKNKGDYEYVEDNAIIIRNQNGKALRIVGSLKDISKEKTYRQTLREVNKVLKERNLKLQQINEELEQFTYTASHDLQEPLRMIISFLTLLEKKYAKNLDEKAVNYIFYALDGAKRMRQLILSLLEISQIGHMDQQKEDIDLNKLLSDVKKSLNRQIREKEAAILFDDLPIINSYYAPLVQIFQNLISNAIKYSHEERKPEVKITCKKSKKNNNYQFTVEDNGKGIPRQHQNRVFIMFVSLDNNHEIPGSGMGLAIVKKIIEKQNGSIKLKSEPGEGTKLTFTLPISKNKK